MGASITNAGKEDWTYYNTFTNRNGSLFVAGGSPSTLKIYGMIL